MYHPCCTRRSGCDQRIASFERIILPLIIGIVGVNDRVLYLRHMMKYLILFLFIVGSNSLFAQAGAAPENNKSQSLEERFQNMKSKSESYQDYKVIKAATLDAEWKIFMDSIRANKSIWQDAKRSMATQQNEIKAAQEALKQKESSMADITYSSTHINFAGIDFSKQAFVIMMVILLAGLGLFVVLLLAKLKLMSSSIREKADLAEVTMREYEEYKHKALDKQTKLSRELQNERNKLAEMKHN